MYDVLSWGILMGMITSIINNIIILGLVFAAAICIYYYIKPEDIVGMYGILTVGFLLGYGVMNFWVLKIKDKKRHWGER